MILWNVYNVKVWYQRLLSITFSLASIFWQTFHGFERTSARDYSAYIQQPCLGIYGIKLLHAKIENILHNLYNLVPSLFSESFFVSLELLPKPMNE